MENKLYPYLNEEGNKAAVEIIESFKKDIIKVAEKAISDLYVDIGCYIESDSWSNYRNSILSGLKEYPSPEKRYDFKQVRKQILEEHREEIIKDLNQDSLDRIKELESELIRAYDRRY